ncbi:tRNA (guanine(26)-N(2))-dimethyltransferase [Uranotaenia lowii]|uniref:tRNA (guanine(26)-N(2))-dimethyltransferase n=1 Tax=Uranotaenia lowii TaxID=190385 RepID=UPI00247AC319|nr:tRNA (guanine(26)-N(2))-dimethyltransferase [Uranotaenia lowii]
MSETNTVVEPVKLKTISEGSAKLLVGERVFYNPVQEFNRDLSICVLATFSRIYQKEKLQLAQKRARNGDPPVEVVPLVAGEKCEKGLRILEALAATGLRSVRYANEIPGVKEIVANDYSKSAVESIEENVQHNKLEHLITPSFNNAMTLMYTSTQPEQRFTAIDLDPYGTPARFLDGAVQAVEDGGLLLITATDMAVLAGKSPEACYVKYGSMSVKTKACHEMALRILLRSIESTATRYGRYIVPLLSISVDFYVRVFVRIYTSQQACKKSSSKHSMVFQCTGCESFTLQPLGSLKPNPTPTQPEQVKFGIPTGPFVSTKCEHCYHQHHMGGPMWSEPLYDSYFLEELLSTIEMEPFKNLGTINRIQGMLCMISEELPDVPLYYTLDRMCSILRLETIPMLNLRSALIQAGYRVSYSHANRLSVKTDAPVSVLWDILRCWAKTHPVKKERFVKGTPTEVLHSKEPAQEYDVITIVKDAQPVSKKKSMTRFQQNPTPHWGPGTRDTLMVNNSPMIKSVQNQNTKKKRRKLEKQQQNESENSKETTDSPERKHQKTTDVTEDSTAEERKE